MRRKPLLGSLAVSAAAACLWASMPADAGSAIPENGYSLHWQVTADEQWSATTTTKVFIGDFDGNSLDDVFFYGPGTAADSLWLSKPYDSELAPSTTDRFDIVSISVNGNMYEPFVGNFDGDTTDDIFWYAPGTQPDYIWYMSEGDVELSVNRNVNGIYTPTVADFDQRPNRSGAPVDSGYADDIFWYGGANAETMWTGWGDRTFTTSTFPTNVGSGAKPLLGNFVDDSPIAGYYVPDLLFYIAGTGQDTLWRSNGDGTFNVSNKTINGSYTPIVGTFTTELPGWAGGQTDVIWYSAGTAADTAWMADGSGNFTSRSVTINGRYTPSVIPGALSSDTVVWSNTGGGDSVWAPKGTSTTLSYDTRAWPGSDPGSRKAIVGRFDDVTRYPAYVAEYVKDRFGLPGAPVPNADRSVIDTTTTEVFQTVSVEMPQYDVLWWAPGSATGQTELFWRGEGPSVFLSIPAGETTTTGVI